MSNRRTAVPCGADTLVRVSASTALQAGAESSFPRPQTLPSFARPDSRRRLSLCGPWQFRHLLVPVGCLFVSLGRLERNLLLPRRGGELHADRQAFFGKAAWD